MRALLILAALLALSTVTLALPVKEKKEEHKEEPKEAEEGGEDWELNLEYGRYLKEVVQALESDPSFRKKLETAEVDDIKSGKIARELHFVDHNVRTKLDELKRRELERLRHLAIKEYEKETGVNRNLLKIPAHVDHVNPNRFEVEDLKKLIVKTTEDLEKVDAQRREDFKKYELEKEYDRQHELQGMDEEHRNQADQKHNEEVKKHKQHEKLHHPGSKQQLEEVWEEQDHMKAEDFDPKTFFHLHDLDGNGYWDEMEVKALFKKELDKMYDPNASEDDMNERYEEMERMREHVFKESDVNRDSLISFDEFVEQTRKTEFEQDGGWQGLDEQELYSQQEYEAYQRQREEEIRRLVEAGAVSIIYFCYLAVQVCVEIQWISLTICRYDKGPN
ncbi:Nucleobindin-2 [Halocaridina rubra]|uniref:Nucleobindin-2 n=1 Tax=Halocaridina rubra TaxID=373956 RepID=A0AAN8X6W5_HALRR